MRLRCMGNIITVATTCKTWGCLGCRDRVKMYVKLRMEHGTSIVPEPQLITVTYAYRGVGSRRDASSVGRDWASLMRLWNKRHHQKTPWFRVPELTKKGQVHLHLIVGGLTNRIPCCQPGSHGSCAHKKGFDWAMAPCPVNCVEHELAKDWYGITGDSWVVDCRPVWGASGAASYLFKYLEKGFAVRTDLEALGFKRRWSCSRDWPSPEKMQFAVTLAQGWEFKQFWRKGGIHEGALRKESQSNHPGYSIKVGTPMAEKYEKRLIVAGAKRLRKKVLGAESSI